ncbi:MAG: ComF family protein [Acidimicrobiales bacterium]|nr:ComF family protein [Acidimicrobiales bacterium]
MTRLKYRNQRSSLRWLGSALADLVDAEAVDVVTWAPTTGSRVRERGFDHAELIARRVAGRTGVPVRSLLDRGPGPAQTGRSEVERHSGPSFLPRRSLCGSSVLLIDDVMTTGSTLSAAARALRTAGASRVRGLVVAHRPWSGRRHQEPEPNRLRAV